MQTSAKVLFVTDNRYLLSKIEWILLFQTLFCLRKWEETIW